jgi:hypothetical protein
MEQSQVCKVSPKIARAKAFTQPQQGMLVNYDVPVNNYSIGKRIPELKIETVK